MSKRILSTLVAAAAVAVVAAPAGNAALACAGTVQPFMQFGDKDSYFAFPNNGFESGTTVVSPWLPVWLVPALRFR